MTVRLLVKYGKYEPNTLYEGSNEAQLVAQNIASTNLTGGVAYATPGATKYQTPVSLEMVAAPGTGTITDYFLADNRRFPTTGGGGPPFDDNDAVSVDEYDDLVSGGDWAPAFTAALAVGNNVIATPGSTYKINSTVTMSKTGQTLNLGGALIDATTATGDVFRLTGEGQSLFGGKFTGDFTGTAGTRAQCAVNVTGQNGTVMYGDFKNFLGGGVIIRGSGANVAFNRFDHVSYAPSAANGADYGAVTVGSGLKDVTVAYNRMINCEHSGVSVGGYGYGHNVSNNRIKGLKTMPLGSSDKGRSTGVYVLGPQIDIDVSHNRIFNMCAEGVNMGTGNSVITYDVTAGNYYTVTQSGTTITVASVGTVGGAISVGDVLFATGMPANTVVVQQLTNTNGTSTPGREGTYQVTTSATIGSATQLRAYPSMLSYISGGTTLTVTSISANAGLLPIAVGDEIFGPGVAPNQRIVSFGTGTGGVGTYTLSVNQADVANSGAPVTTIYTNRTGQHATQGVTIAGNTLRECYAGAIVLYGSQDYQMSNVGVTGNRIYAGAPLGSGTNPAAAGNPLRGSAHGIYVDGVIDSAITGNTMSGGMQNGITITNDLGGVSRRLDIVGNSVVAASQYGMQITGDDHNVTGNTLQQAALRGLRVVNTSRGVIAGNNGLCSASGQSVLDIGSTALNMTVGANAFLNISPATPGQEIVDTAPDANPTKYTSTNGIWFTPAQTGGAVTGVSGYANYLITLTGISTLTKGRAGQLVRLRATAGDVTVSTGGTSPNGFATATTITNNTIKQFVHDGTAWYLVA